MSFRFTPRLKFSLITLSFAVVVNSVFAETGDGPEASTSSATQSGLSWQDNLFWAVDLSSRGGWTSGGDGGSAQQTIGLDLRKVFGTGYGDWGTLLVQYYLQRIDNLEKHPGFYEGDDDWELVPRNVFFEYTGLNKGQVGIRAGRIELPFGLDQPIDTNGTLRQLATSRNVGLKADWGVGIRGTQKRISYDMVWSLGSGKDPKFGNDTYAVSGRVSGRVISQLFLGVSGFKAKMLRSSGYLERDRFGLDLQWFPGPVALLGEFTLGGDNSKRVLSGFWEANWTSPFESWTVYFQNHNMFRDEMVNWDNFTNLVLGLRYIPHRDWILSTQYEQVLDEFSNNKVTGNLQFQIRYRY